jgi:hypothetical protein
MDLHIQNNCNQKLSVLAFVGRYKAEEQTLRLEIEPYSDKLVYQCETINEISKESIPYFVQRLTITMDGKATSINPLDADRWIFEEISEYKLFQSYYHSRATLSINPEDFEDE